MPFFLAESNCITESVNLFHPNCWWELGVPSLTVNVELINSTPWVAHFSRFPCLGVSILRSLFNSLKIFFNDGGSLMPVLTENASPLAWSNPWYGSWPITTTFTSE